jgi:hypothetical protein
MVKYKYITIYEHKKPAFKLLNNNSILGANTNTNDANNDSSLLKYNIIDNSKYSKTDVFTNEDTLNYLNNQQLSNSNRTTFRLQAVPILVDDNNDYYDDDVNDDNCYDYQTDNQQDLSNVSFNSNLKNSSLYNSMPLLNNNNYNTSTDTAYEFNTASATQQKSKWTVSSSKKPTKQRARSPDMLIDLVISTPKSDIKIHRKCKSYEVSILFLFLILLLLLLLKNELE